MPFGPSLRGVCSSVGSNPRYSAHRLNMPKITPAQTAGRARSRTRSQARSPTLGDGAVHGAAAGAFCLGTSSTSEQEQEDAQPLLNVRRRVGANQGGRGCARQGAPCALVAADAATRRGERVARRPGQIPGRRELAASRIPLISVAFRGRSFRSKLPLPCRLAVPCRLASAVPGHPD
jgi:hypothetical protein